MRTASFDIGKKNFAFCIQIFPEISSYQNETDLIHQIETTGMIEELENLDLTIGCNSKLYLDPLVFGNLTKELSDRDHLWDNVDVFVVEQQVCYKGVRNPMALKIMQHVISYFWIKHSGKPVIEFAGFHKGQILGAPKEFGTITVHYKNGNSREIKDTLKKWAIRKATEILEKRQDLKNMEKLVSMRKKDDASDTILQGIAHQVLIRIPKAGQHNRATKRYNKRRRKKTS